MAREARDGGEQPARRFLINDKELVVGGLCAYRAATGTTRSKAPPLNRQVYCFCASRCPADLLPGKHATHAIATGAIVVPDPQHPPYCPDGNSVPGMNVPGSTGLQVR